MVNIKMLMTMLCLSLSSPAHATGSAMDTYRELMAESGRAVDVKSSGDYERRKSDTKIRKRCRMVYRPNEIDRDEIVHIWECER